MALLAATFLGFCWMGEGGAVAFALIGLWGCYGAARPWRMSWWGLVLVLAGTTLAPALLWKIGAANPPVAEALYMPLAPWIDRLLEFTQADEAAYEYVAARDRLSEMTGIRLGLGSCALLGLPSAAAIVLWFRPEMPGFAVTGAGWGALRPGLAAVAVIAASSALMIYGVGGHPFSTLGAAAYPLVVLLWLVSIAVLRAWLVRDDIASHPDQ